LSLAGSPAKITHCGGAKIMCDFDLSHSSLFALLDIFNLFFNNDKPLERRRQECGERKYEEWFNLHQEREMRNDD
jgi:hypothetical protein